MVFLNLVIVLFNESSMREEEKVTEHWFFYLVEKAIYQLLQCRFIHAHMSYKCKQLDFKLTMVCRNLEGLTYCFWWTSLLK